MATIPFDEVKKIFFLNLIPDTVGDTLMILPLIKSLKRQVPHAEIIVTSSKNNAELISGTPEINKIIQLPLLSQLNKPTNKLRKFLNYLQLMKKVICVLHKEKPDVCIVLQPNFAPSQLIPWLAHIRYRVGYEYRKAVFAWTLTTKARFRSPYETGDYHYHYLESNFDLLRAAGLDVKEEDKIVRHIVSDDTKKWADAFLKNKGISSNDNLIAFQAGAKWRSKTWPAERFIAVGQALVKKHHTRILLFGAAHERETYEQIAKVIGPLATVVVGERIGRVAALLKVCDLAFGNDSGIMHLASAVGTPPIVLYGMTIPDHSGPKGTGGFIPLFGAKYDNRPILGPNDTEEGINRMESISVDDAIMTITNAMKKRKK